MRAKAQTGLQKGGFKTRPYKNFVNFVFFVVNKSQH